MTVGKMVEIPGGGSLDYQAGRFYLLDSGLADELIANGEAVDPEAPPPEPEPPPSPEPEPDPEPTEPQEEGS